jgi:hypothetical protein
MTVLSIDVYFSKKFYYEKKYIVKTLFSYFENIELRFFTHDFDEYRISLGTGLEIIFDDDFFSSQGETYLTKESLPTQVHYIQNVFTPETDLPVLYGSDNFILENSRIHCSADIFASAFFMLTRWEETISREKDKFGRFPDELSFVQRHKLHYRPIVNEYIEMLHRMLVYLGQTAEISRKYTVIPTHDIDFLFRLNTLPKLIKSLAGDVLKRKNPIDFTKTLVDYTKSLFNSKNDPYNTFEFLSDISKKNNLVSRFYFMPSYKGEHEAKYDIRNKKIEKIIKKLSENGNIIGLHGTVSAYQNKDIFAEEKQRLESVLGLVTECRMHFLRLSVPESFRMFDACNILTDSTLCFSNDGGFRAGICFEFPVFDVLARKELNLWEMPLIVMETALRKKYPQEEEFYKAFQNLASIVKKYQGEFVFLWHNSNLNTGIWKGWKKIYEKLVQDIL